MNRIRMGVLPVVLGLLVTLGCASSPPFPESSLTGGVVEVKIGASLTPQMVSAKPGDEVRWVNTTSDPVEISLVHTQDDLISCQKGFGSTGWGYLFGSLEHEVLVAATLHMNDSASLCFAVPGTYTYTVRTKTAMTSHTTRIAGSIMIE